MSELIINISPELRARVDDWGRQLKKPPELLAVELLEEYFSDCDDADKLEALIRSGDMKTYPAVSVHKELGNFAVVGG